MSMSIPFLWQEVLWKKEWGSYRPNLGKPPIDVTGNAIVDGGLLSNFPLELLVSDSPQVEAVMGTKQNENVIGLLIDDRIPVSGTAAATDDAKPNVLASLRTSRRLRNIINTITMARDKMVIAAFEQLVVRLPAGGYGTTEFGMSDARRNALVNAGKQAMEAYRQALTQESFKSIDPAMMRAAYEQANEMAVDMLNR